MLRLRATLAVGLWLALIGTAWPEATVTVDHAARVAAALEPGVRLKGVAPVRHSIEARMRELKVPGVSVAVVDGGRIAWARGFGVKERGGADAVTPATLFQAGSIGKAITATITLRLVQQGKLALDENANNYLKSWKVPENQLTTREKVTLRRLMSHSAGLTVPSFHGYFARDPLPTVVQILDGVKPAQTDPVRVDVVPGSICRYSGGGTTVEQLLLTDTTGEEFPALAKELLFDPVGMADTTFEQTLPPALSSRASGAHDSTGEMIWGGHLIHPELAAAGLWSTPSDLLRWAMEIAAARAGKSTRILSREMATQMLTVQKRPLGLGPFLGGSGRGFNFAHRGWNPGFHSKVVYFPETGQGAAVMINGDGGRGMVDEILGAVGTEYSWPGSPPEPIEVLAVDDRTAEGVVGTYQGMKPHAITVTAAVTRDGGKLILDAPVLGAKTELVFTAPNELVALDRGDRFTVIPEKGGRVTALVYGDMKMSRLAGPELQRAAAARTDLARERPYPPLPARPLAGHSRGPSRRRQPRPARKRAGVARHRAALPRLDQPAGTRARCGRSSRSTPQR
jgi:CubicO group peptidase (beta-lactamase class C family)